jgi:hypothetical protein
VEAVKAPLGLGVQKPPCQVEKWVWDRRMAMPPSKHCVSGQRFCSAAISSKSTGSAADATATAPMVVWFGRDKKSATTFFKPGKYDICTLNYEMNAKWHCCLGEMGAETREMAVTSGL